MSLQNKNKWLPAVSLILLSCLFADSLTGQKIDGRQKAAEEIFTARIKQFNEFADRFNLATDFNGNPADQTFRSKMPRTNMLQVLFDLKDPRIQDKSRTYSEEFVSLKTEFIKDITGNGRYLDKYSPGIIAETRSRVLIDGNPRTLRIFLNQEVVGRDQVKWVILDVKGEIPGIFKTDTTMIRFIPPTSNETDFINLKRALEDKDYLHYYAYDGFKPDKLTMFFSMVNSGRLIYEYAVEVVYHIISIPGWRMKVIDFNRNELNSGWLITDLARNDLNIHEFIEGIN